MTTKEQAIKIAEKVLKDIDFWGDDVINPRARLIEGENLSPNEKAYWLVGYNYGAEDFGPKAASVYVDVDVSSGKPALQVTTRNGSIPISYNAQNDKYSRV